MATNHFRLPTAPGSPEPSNISPQCSQTTQHTSSPNRPAPTKTEALLEERRLKCFATAMLETFKTALLECWTSATNSASFEAFHSTGDALPQDCQHYSLFSGMAQPELELLNMSIAERFPKANQALLRKCVLASIASLIAQQLVRESV
jgi:hypothetical protein